jgi:transcription elongation factor GreA
MSYPITKSCYDKLYKELSYLKKQRPIIAEKIEAARGHGDLKENAEYHAARDEQGMTEAKINHIEAKLADANIIDTSSLPKNKIFFGSTVKIEDCDNGNERIFQIVSEDEVSVSNGKISINSPIARGMISKTVGDTFTVSAPKGEIEYEVIEII